MILKQITDVKIKMLDKDPYDLKALIEKKIPEITVEINDSRNLTVQTAGEDIKLYEKKLNTCILKWLGEAGFDFPTNMLYETYIISSSKIIIKV